MECSACARQGSTPDQRLVAPLHGIDSSACNKIEAGIDIPIDFAVLRFTINFNLVGCSIGRSAGFAPLRILSIYAAARFVMAMSSGPYASRAPASAITTVSLMVGIRRAIANR